MPTSAKGVTSEGTYSPDDLFAGDEIAPVGEKVTIIDQTGTWTLSRGMVLGQITTSGKFTPVDDAQATGEEVARAVLAEDVGATDADAEGLVYFTGVFNEDALSFGGDDTIADHRVAMREKGLHTRKITAA